MAKHPHKLTLPLWGFVDSVIKMDQLLFSYKMFLVSSFLFIVLFAVLFIFWPETRSNHIKGIAYFSHLGAL